MNEIIDKVKFFTERDRLDRKTRQREIVYKRAYLMYVMRNQLLMTFQEIGNRFNVTHPTVLYWSNMVHFYLNQSKDQVYINQIQEYLKAFEGTKYTPEYRNLEEDILNCISTYELKLIKERIKENKYGNNDSY
mgnify:CR=1 FL=1|jgi:hypothetical protein